MDKINPDACEITLKNNKTIKYETLVLAMGQKNNFSEIKGFEEAWEDKYHTFYTNMDHPGWKTTVTKAQRTHLNFNGGEAFFYIPPNNFYGEIQDYNFFVTKDHFNLMAKSGKISWDTSKFTVVNPNGTFSRYAPKVDEYIREKCAVNNIGIEENLVLQEVRPVKFKLPRLTTSLSSKTPKAES